MPVLWRTRVRPPAVSLAELILQVLRLTVVYQVFGKLWEEAGQIKLALDRYLWHDIGIIEHE